MRPLTTRAASHFKSTCYRAITLVDRLVRWRDSSLLPPAHLRIYYYRTRNPAAFERACELVRVEVLSHGLEPRHRVLDIGSGIGNLALGLVGYLHGSYEGIDIHPEAVAWCQHAITPRYPNFRFHRADLASEAYNPRGRSPQSTFRFPFPDGEFDFIFLGSVFTHMLPDAVEHYLREISRMLRPGGICAASYFLLNDEIRAAVCAGRSFIAFPIEDPSGRYRLHQARKPEAAVALEESFVRNGYRAAGLQVRNVRRGAWWSGRSDDQDVVTAIRES